MTVPPNEPSARPVGASYADYPLAFARAQMACWRARGRIIGLEAQLRAEMERHPNVFLLEIQGQDVVVHSNAAIDRLVQEGHALEVVRRIGIFSRLISDAIREAPMPRRLVVAVDTGDLAEGRLGVPLFSFQRRKGDRILLLPDFELVSLDYLNVEGDGLPYGRKADMAFFSGSTTGRSNFTLEDIARDEVPRVRAARFFQAHPRVRFLLPALVQYASEEVAAALRAEGFGRERTPLLDTYSFKFGISIDGNGAPCSRPAIVLKSNSALMKYDSQFELYYNMGLLPWLHFIPISKDNEVVEVVEVEAKNPEYFEHIAVRGREFAEHVLSRPAILAYTKHVLDLYQEIFS